MHARRIGLVVALLGTGIAGDAAADCGLGYQSYRLELTDVVGVDASALDVPDDPRVTNTVWESSESQALTLAWEEDGSRRSMSLEGR